MTIGQDLEAQGWITHEGHCDPVNGRGAVDVILRDGEHTMSRFGFWQWSHGSSFARDIVAWRPDRASQQERQAA